MRLLKLQDGKVSLIKFDKDPPKYAIMSHTWGAAEDEVQFEDVTQGKAENRKGYEKIKFCAKQAASHNLEYFWIDTCCINKADLQEFQSAINLMFRWYQNAEICFVYMTDVATDGSGPKFQEQSWKESFRNSRWFTRSWTLQELLSPRKIEFYSYEHQCLGNRTSLEAELHIITGIPVPALCGTGLAQFSTEQRISWARGRDSTFEEDQAYSLLGLCGVTMAPNYGEGAKAAFKRLRKRCDKMLRLEPLSIMGNFIVRSDLNYASRIHQLPSPSSNISALAAMFGACIDGMRRIDSYSNHGTDLGAIVSQFNIDIQGFKDWGKAVGIDGQKPAHGHHENLNDPEISSAIQRILVTIQDVADKLDEGLSDQQNGLEAMSFRSRAQDSRQPRLGKSGEVALNSTRIEWTSRRQARFLALSQQFGSLVRNLQALVPIEASNFADLMAGQAQRGYLLSDNYALQKSVKGVNDASNQMDLQRIIAESRKRLERDMKRELDNWLDASSTTATYSDSIQKKLPDTCDWIMDREVFHDWESADLGPKVLWINGPAGYGKTVLSAWIVQHLKDRNDTPLAFFFFSADLEDRADPFVVIRSWISQIASQNQDAFDLAYRKLEIHKGQSASSVEMMELFKEIVQRVANCTCIVDGLDECSSKEGWSATRSNTLAEFIRMTIQSLSGTSSRVLIVSRDDQQIRKGFVELSSDSTEIEMLEYKITPDDVKPDAIKLSYSLVDQKLNKKSTALRAEIANRIVDRCDSMFLRIKLLENDIRSGKNQRQLERIVDQAPTELHNLYDRNWARIMSRGNDRVRALAILRWIAFGLRPITIFEMTEALLLTDFEDIDDLEDELPDEVDEPYIQTEILEICESLVETRAGVSPDNLGLRTLHLTHFTVRQYILLHLPVHASQLEAERDLTSSNDLAQHNILAEACLRYLGISTMWNKGQDEEKTNELKGSFRSYAMDSWNKHAKQDGDNYTIVSRLMISFFCSNDGWETWRKYFDASQAQSIMLQYDGDITTASRLFYATFLGLQDVFDTLMKNASIDVDHVDESNRTALFAAAHEGRLGLLRTLLQKNADINKPSNQGRTPLYVASNNGHIEIVKFLLENGADLTLRNKHGWTPLNAASYCGKVEVVRLLLEKGADFTIGSEDGRTPLDSASDSGSLEVVKLLLEKGADLSLADNDGWTPLRAACFGGHVEVAKLLLEKGADLTIADKNDWTPLNSACDNGHVEVVKLLLEKGADPNIANNDGWTPLRAACYNGYIEVAKLLLEKGADLTIADKNRWTPFNSACDNGHIEVVKLLLEKGADLSIASNDGWTPLRAACFHGHTEVVKLLLEKGADLTIVDKNGWTPLNSACDSGHIEVVKLLLEKGADLSTANSDGWTPLRAACYNGYPEVAKLLLEKGANLTITDKNGWTPLNSACDSGHIEVVKLLLEKGADLSIANNDKRAPLYCASCYGHLEVAKLLLEKGADPIIADNDGWTPLRAACFNGHTEVVKLLLEQGSDPNIADNDGWTPLNSASNKGYVEVVKLLLGHGAKPNLSNDNRWTPLNSASHNGYIDIANLLLERGADITISNKDGWSPLYTAASKGHLDVVKLLFKLGADITVADTNGLTPLHNAAFSGHLDVVKFLLENGASITAASKDGITPLHNAAFNSHLDVVKLLLENGADSMAGAKDGTTTLHNATFNGKIDVVNLLLSYGADTMAGGKDGITPLHNAAFNGHLDAVKLLFENGASITGRREHGVTPHYGPLHNAALNGHLAVVEFLVKNGADVMDQSKHGITPLHNAAYNGHLDVVKHLLENGADIMGGSKDGTTALHNAAFNGHLDVVKHLLENGAKILDEGKNGSRPHFGALHNAALNGHLDVTRCLVENGADIMAESAGGITPLHNAVSRGNLDVVKYLVEAGANVEFQSRRGWAPIYTAATNGHVEVVKFLFEKGADITVADNHGSTCLHVAARRGNEELVKALCEISVVDLSKQDNNGRTPIFFASLYGNVEVLNFLLSKYPDGINTKDHYNATPLVAAVRRGHKKVVVALLASSASLLDSKDYFGRTVHYWATRTGDSRLLGIIELYASSASVPNREVAEGLAAGPPTPVSTSAWCDVCAVEIARNVDHYKCPSCDGGEFWICMECFEFGVHCQDRSHKWDFMKEQQTPPTI